MDCAITRLQNLSLCQRYTFTERLKSHPAIPSVGAARNSGKTPKENAAATSCEKRSRNRNSKAKAPTEKRVQTTGAPFARSGQDGGRYENNSKGSLSRDRLCLESAGTETGAPGENIR